MGAPLVRVVEQPHVTRLHAPAFLGHAHGRPHGKGHGPHKHRQSRFALNQGVTRGRVVQPVTGVVGFGNDGVERAAVKRGVHFIGDLLQPAPQHGQRDRVHRRGLFSQ